MRPLQSVAMGLVVVALTARAGGFDLLPDPLGWFLVVLGLQQLPAGADRRLALRLVVLALAVSAVLWLPATGSWLDERDAALRWAANLPQAVALTWLAWMLARRAAPTDARAGRWLRAAAVLLAVAAVLPVLVLGGGLFSLEPATYVVAALAVLVLVTLLFTCAARPWAEPAAHLP